jgi:drug/metabolite transporter (DMT)-like permease
MEPATTNWKAHLILFSTSLIQGFNFSLAKIVMPDYISPEAIILIRGISAVIWFWLWDLIFVKEKIKSQSHFLRISGCSILGVALNQMLFYKGLSLTKPINASLMVTISPVMVLVISAIVLKEKITFSKIAGILCGATGVILLLINSGNEGPDEIFLGDLFILLNAAAYAGFLVLVKPLMTEYHPNTILKWIFLMGMVLVMPLSLTDLLHVNWTTIPTAAWFALGYVVIFATLVAYTLNVGVMKVVNPSVAGIYIYLQPVMASIIAVSFGKDVLGPDKVLFSAMIFIGVYLVSRK